MLNPQGVWQAQTAHQSIKEYEFDDYIFASATEISGKTLTELEGEPEENCMTVNVKTISGKTISITCDKTHKADTVSEKVEMKTPIPRSLTYLDQGKVLNDKKTIEENNIWSRSYDRNVFEIVRRNGTNEMMDSIESEDEREKKRELEEMSEGQSTRP